MFSFWSDGSGGRERIGETALCKNGIIWYFKSWKPGVFKFSDVLLLNFNDFSLGTALKVKECDSQQWLPANMVRQVMVLSQPDTGG